MPKSDKPCISPRIYHMYTEEDEAKEEATSLRRQGYSSVRTFWRTVNAGGASARYLVVVVYTLRNDGAHTWRSLEHSPTQVCTVCGARRRHPAAASLDRLAGS